MYFHFMIKYLYCIAISIVLFSFPGMAQRKITWSTINSSYYTIENGEIFNYTLPANSIKATLTKQQLVPSGSTTAIIPSSFSLSRDESKILIYTNTKKCGAMKPGEIIGYSTEVIIH